MVSNSKNSRVSIRHKDNEYQYARICLTVSEKQMVFIEKLAAKREVSKQQIIRDMILEAIIEANAND
jgi:hypothetical protein